MLKLTFHTLVHGHWMNDTIKQWMIVYNKKILVKNITINSCIVRFWYPNSLFIWIWVPGSFHTIPSMANKIMCRFSCCKCSSNRKTRRNLRQIFHETRITSVTACLHILLTVIIKRYSYHKKYERGHCVQTTTIYLC